MKLADIITGREVVSVITESDTHVALSLVDQQTGDVLRVDITADMAVLPDEALLDFKVVGDRGPQVDLAAWWDRGDVMTDGEVPQVFTQAEPEPTWTVTPDGREFDLRAHEGGLF